MRPISLHHIVIPEVRPAELVRIAADLGCRHVCLFTYLPGAARFPVVADAEMDALEAVMNETGVSAYGITSFELQPGTDESIYRPALERGARLGAVYASVRLAQDDDPAVVDALARFSALAESLGITASIEVMAYDAPERVRRAIEIVDKAGCGTMTVDPLHMVRSGALDEFRQLPRERIGYVQLCDGPLHAPRQDYARESGAERFPPGEGAFPLADILGLVPAGRAISTEVPNPLLRSEMAGPVAWAARVVAATRDVLERCEPGAEPGYKPRTGVVREA